MACSPMNIPTTSHIIGIGLRRSSSGEDLCKQATMRKSYSENNLLSSSTRLLATSASPHSTKLKLSHSFGMFTHTVSSSTARATPIKTQLYDTKPDIENDTRIESDTKIVDDRLDDNEMEEKPERGKRGKRVSWVERVLELRKQWKGRKEKEVDCRDGDEGDQCDGEDGCLADYGEIEDEIKFDDSESFTKLLVRVPWIYAKRFSKLAYLCNKAYTISGIKAHDLHRHFGVRFVTSSLEKKAKVIALNAKLSHDSTHLREDNIKILHQREKTISPSIAYEIAASAACHVQSRAKYENHSSPFTDHATYIGSKEVCPVPRGCKSEMAAQMAATTMTSVVAAKEREKQAVAKELQSLQSSPCEWFICDDPKTRVRLFVIQGSESLASWQANLFFEPAKFEETDALVHRGIYEAAKGLYEQFMPEIQNHLDAYGEYAKFQFTGHSLGGSLSLLVHLMLIARRVVKPYTLLPVVTFGSPFVFCGGEKIMKQLRLHESMVQNVIMHRDIVPRAFSCNYPRQVEQVLKRLNSSFKSHPCLNKHKMLYSPLGQVFILQPSEYVSPSHPLLPQGCALYTFSKAEPSFIALALKTFLNTPHPLETLSDPRAYGSKGTILRDHHSKNYSKAVNNVMKQYTSIAFQKFKKDRQVIWPLMDSPSQYSWIHEGSLENISARKEVMTSV